MSLRFERSRLEQHLAEAATGVLETMFFASAEEILPEANSIPDNSSASRIGASLCFHGACSGILTLSMEIATATSLAKNFFGGVGENGIEEDRRTVTGELTNMVCGAMLSRIDNQSIFCLDSPTSLMSGAEPEGEIVKTLRMDEGLLRLCFSIQHPIPLEAV